MRKLILTMAAFALPSLAAANDGVDTLHYALDFSVQDGFTNWWKAEWPTINTGTVVVVSVDPDMAFPKQTHNPVLYAGDTPLFVVGLDAKAGCVAGIVPGGVDLQTAPVFWDTTPILPEQVTDAVGAEALDAALATGAKPFESATLASARAAAEGAPVLATGEDVLSHANGLTGLCN